jgi:hypothetical protein
MLNGRESCFKFVPLGVNVNIVRTASIDEPIGGHWQATTLPLTTPLFEPATLP